MKDLEDTLYSETVNGRGFYESDFDQGPNGYGIWWTGSDGSWRIGPISYKGQVYGLRAYIDEKCVENVHPWNYLPSSGWTSFGSTLSTNCVNTTANSGSLIGTQNIENFEMFYPILFLKNDIFA